VESGSSALHPSPSATTSSNAWWRLSLPLVLLILVASALGGSDSRNFRLTTRWHYDFFQKLVVFLSIFFLNFSNGPKVRLMRRSFRRVKVPTVLVVCISRGSCSVNREEIKMSHRAILSILVSHPSSSKGHHSSNYLHFIRKHSFPIETSISLKHSS